MAPPVRRLSFRMASDELAVTSCYLDHLSDGTSPFCSVLTTRAGSGWAPGALSVLAAGG